MLLGDNEGNAVEKDKNNKNQMKSSLRNNIPKLRIYLKQPYLPKKSKSSNQNELNTGCSIVFNLKHPQILLSTDNIKKAITKGIELQTCNEQGPKPARLMFFPNLAWATANIKIHCKD